MNLDDRIARDAERWRKDDHAPPFEPALELATTVSGHRRATWLAVACGVLVVALACAVIATRGSSDRSTPAVHPSTSTSHSPAVSVALPTPHTITRDGTTYRATLIATPALISTGSSRALSTLLFDHYANGEKPGCNSFDASVRVVSQTATTITVASFDYEVKTSGVVECTFVSSGNEKLQKTIPVQLKRPLGTRTVVDAKSGKRVAVLSSGSTAPTPHYLPPGYKPEKFGVIRVGGSYGPNALGVYAGPGNASLEIHLGSASDARTGGTIVGKADVSGYPATVTDESYQRCVSWTKQNGQALQVCSLDSQTHRYLSVAELLKIARSLR